MVKLAPGALLPACPICRVARRSEAISQYLGANAAPFRRACLRRWSERATDGSASSSAAKSLTGVPIVSDKSDAGAVPMGDFKVIFRFFAGGGSADCRINLQAAGISARAVRRGVNTQGAAVAPADKNVVHPRCQCPVDIFFIPAGDMVFERRRRGLVTQVGAARKAADQNPLYDF